MPPAPAECQYRVWSPQLVYAWPHRVEEIAASYRTPGIA